MALLLALTGLCYWPGLSGPFLLDDRINLAPLGLFGEIESLRDLGRYALNGATSPIGRPLTLLTFAANAQDWPADPWWFKFTSLGLHLVNGMLVFWLARLLARRAGLVAGAAAAAALGAAGLWLLHPIQISSVLYISQRMTVLATLFVLAALIVYVHGRELGAVHPKTGLWLQSTAIGAGLLLSLLSKETGILLPLFVLVLEATLLHPQMGLARPYRWRAWSAVFLWLPLLAVTLYLLRDWRLFVDGGWAGIPLLETWMTQARVLWQYLGFVFLPFLHFPGLFDDDFVASSGLLEPVTTLAAVCAVIALLAAAWRLRARAPVLAFGVLWFFAGHALESSFVGLEPVFEYRNYLALLGPAFAVAWLPVRYLRPVPLGAIVLVLAGAGLAWQTTQAAAVWGDERALAVAWAGRHPASLRAQHFLIRLHVEEGRYRQALALAKKSEAHHPDDLWAELDLLRVRCDLGILRPGDLREALQDAARTDYRNAVFDVLRNLESYAKARICPPLDRQALIGLLATLTTNPHYAHDFAQHQLQYRRAVLLSEIPRTQAAVRAADLALAVTADPNVAYNAARWLLQAGQPRRALDYIEQARAAAKPDSWIDRWFGSRQVRGHDERAFRALEAKARQALLSASQDDG